MGAGACLPRVKGLLVEDSGHVVGIPIRRTSETCKGDNCSFGELLGSLVCSVAARATFPLLLIEGVKVIDFLVDTILTIYCLMECFALNVSIRN